MTKFEENGVRKQKEAYCLSFAEKQFSFSCETCCSRGLRHGDCKYCPIAVSHATAVQEIMSGERKKPSKDGRKNNSGYAKYVDRMGHITLVVNININ